ncbi:MAG: dihydrolipoyl dehydrogenase [Nitrososphaerota archaeon]|jgi:dihydrolipoamide dehydrogenase|nr:dihydrolipoyl dehydrogenase [Nitrososphaerota archaeon]MDG7020576.1 dihydrolipoyl dehydrogenase [Nitrososphaerota archaeon]
MREADVVVIGGGPGGYVCAIRAGQLGLKTVLVERDQLGGVCIAYGCIPSKALISATKLYERAKEGATFGIAFDGIRVDLPALQRWKAGVVSQLETGIATLCKGNKVEVVNGEAELVSADRVNVKTAQGAEEIHTKNVVVATGSRAISLPGLEFDGKVVLSSTEALALEKVPESMLVVGGGYIGLEICGIYQKLGTKVTVVELTDQLLPGTEPDLVRLVQRNLEKRGAKILLRSKVLSLEKGPAGARARVSTPEGEAEMEAQLVLVSVGRGPRTDGIRLSDLGIKTDQRGYIATDEQMKTSVPGIYAVGDVRGQPLLAHKASKEGIVAAEAIAGMRSAAEWRSVPWAIFTDPEISGVGLTERSAAEAGMQVKKSRFSFAALGRALASGEGEGFVRIVSDAGSGRVLGVQIVGPDASNLISEAALAIEMGATVDDIALTMHPHPTLPEAIMEAAESAAGRPIHQVKL